MSEKIIPEHIDPFRYAEQSLGLEGILHIADMKRLNANVAAKEGSIVRVSLQFGVDEQRVTFLTGHLRNDLNLAMPTLYGTP